MRANYSLAGSKNVDRVGSFWMKVDVRSADECWEWQASKNARGYGQFWIGNTFTGSHRFSYELLHGKIGDSNLLACHKCDNPSCCNPKHLFLGTHQDNEADKVSKGRQATGNKNGQGGTKNWKNKLSEQAVKNIRFFNTKGFSNKQLSDMFGVTESMIYYIVTRRSWKWLE
jgi:HNH endonuclease